MKRKNLLLILLAVLGLAALVCLIVFVPLAGKILLWTFLGLLALVVLLLVLPASVYVRYAGGEILVRARVLGVPFTLLPGKERPNKPKKEKPEKPEDEEEPAEEKTKKKRSVSDWMLLIRRIATSAKAGLRVVLKGLWVRDVQLVLPVHAQDAADTAIRCGQMQALVGSVRAVLSNVVHLKCKRLVVLPDFNGAQQEQLYFSCKVLAAPVIMLAAGIVAFNQFIRSRPRRFVRRPAGAQPAAQAKEVDA